MKLSRKKAIELCIELWTWLAKTGKRKSEWPKWDKYSGHIINECWFCEHNGQRYGGCIYCNNHCIYYKKYGHCNPEDTLSYFGHWNEAKTPRTRKKYAKLFLAQIRSLK